MLWTRIVSVPLVCATLACGESSEPATTGKAALSFSVSNTVRRDSALVDELKGTIHGAIYESSKVTVTGPVAGTESVDSVKVDNVDLTSEAAVSPTLHTTVDLAVGTYTFLGFFDVDANGNETEDPDTGDPVTLPVNKFEIKADETVPVLIAFDLLYD